MNGNDKKEYSSATFSACTQCLQVLLEGEQIGQSELLLLVNATTSMEAGLTKAEGYSKGNRSEWHGTAAGGVASAHLQLASALPGGTRWRGRKEGREGTRVEGEGGGEGGGERWHQSGGEGGGSGNATEDRHLMQEMKTRFSTSSVDNMHDIAHPREP